MTGAELDRLDQLMEQFEAAMPFAVALRDYKDWVKAENWSQQEFGYNFTVGDMFHFKTEEHAVLFKLHWG